MRIVGFAEEHIAQVAMIERERFSEPWSEKSLALLCTDGYPSFVLIDGVGEVLGYVSTARALDELQIINVAVRRGEERRGYGLLLMDAVDRYCREAGIVSVSLEVRRSNEAARALYERVGYVAVGIRRGFYHMPAEDAVVMVKNFCTEEI